MNCSEIQITLFRIQFCGLSREEDIFFANEILLEFAGFIFYKKSFRSVDEKMKKFAEIVRSKNLWKADLEILADNIPLWNFGIKLKMRL